MTDKIKRMTLAALFVALGVSMSTFYVPVGIAKCFPIQHFLNVLTVIVCGPFYGVINAFLISLLRNILGMGSLLAFPGSMIGALLAGILYKYTKRISGAWLGEMLGTGVIGSLTAYPFATFLMGKEVGVFFFVIPFGVSTLVGASLSALLITMMNKSDSLKRLMSFEN